MCQFIPQSNNITPWNVFYHSLCLFAYFIGGLSYNLQLPFNSQFSHFVFFEFIKFYSACKFININNAIRNIYKKR